VEGGHQQVVKLQKDVSETDIYHRLSAYGSSLASSGS
jgi:hypothetical protein